MKDKNSINNKDISNINKQGNNKHGIINQIIFSYVDNNMIFAVIKGICIVSILGMLFFNKVIAVVILSPIICYIIYDEMEKNNKRKKQKLTIQFCDAIENVQVSLQVGYSVEKAFENCTEEISKLHGGESLITKELKFINEQTRLGINIEESIIQFSRKYNIKEIADFAEVFSVSKRTDGNIAKVIMFTSRMIREKIETDRKIKTAISSGKAELKVMELMPLFIIGYLRMTSLNYYDILYTTMSGRVIMASILLVYILICYISSRMNNI